MSDGFDTNLLSQVTAPDRKLSISRDRINMNRNAKHDGHKRGGNPSSEQPPGDLDGQAGDQGPAEGGGEIINITI